MLWHLQHVLEFREVHSKESTGSMALSFMDEMVGKRLRLAQEILRDLED